EVVAVAGVDLAAMRAWPARARAGAVDHGVELADAQRLVRHRRAVVDVRVLRLRDQRAIAAVLRDRGRLADVAVALLPERLLVRTLRLAGEARGRRAGEVEAEEPAI